MYIDLVLIQRGEDKKLYYAPAWSHLEHGDEVMTDDGQGIVYASGTIDPDGDNGLMDLIIELSGTETPIPAVIGKIMVNKFAYRRYEREYLSDRSED